MTTMNSFQQEQDESSRFQKFQKDSKQKSSLLKIISQQQYEFKIMKMRSEMMKLET